MIVLDRFSDSIVKKLLKCILFFLFGFCGFVNRNSAMWIKVVTAVYSDFFTIISGRRSQKLSRFFCSCEDSLRRTQKKIVLLLFSSFPGALFLFQKLSLELVFCQFSYDFLPKLVKYRGFLVWHWLFPQLPPPFEPNIHVSKRLITVFERFQRSSQFSDFHKIDFDGLNVIAPQLGKWQTNGPRIVPWPTIMQGDQRITNNSQAIRSIWKT